MDGTESNEDQTREANELYWGSETSVNRIADRLGLSKGSLYAAIEPLPSESICPLCTAPLAYSNRTALEKGTLQCSSCGTEFAEKSRSAGARRKSPESPTRIEESAEAPRPSTSHTRDTRDAAADAQEEQPKGPSRQLVWSTTMLGLGFGMLLHRVLRR